MQLTICSDMTPYGNLLNFPTDQYPKRPFKGVTHGQLVLTKVKTHVLHYEFPLTMP